MKHTHVYDQHTKLDHNKGRDVANPYLQGEALTWGYGTWGSKVGGEPPGPKNASCGNNSEDRCLQPRVVTSD